MTSCGRPEGSHQEEKHAGSTTLVEGVRTYLLPGRDAPSLAAWATELLTPAGLILGTRAFVWCHHKNCTCFFQNTTDNLRKQGCRKDGIKAQMRQIQSQHVHFLLRSTFGSGSSLPSRRDQHLPDRRNAISQPGAGVSIPLGEVYCVTACLLLWAQRNLSIGSR